MPDELAGETVRAQEMASGLYKIKNVPLHATGCAEADVVACAFEPRTRWIQVERLVEDAGNGTIRVYFAEGARNPKVVIDTLVSFGRSYERGSETLVGFTVPPALTVPFGQLCDYLNQTSDDLVVAWDIGKPPAAPH